MPVCASSEETVKDAEKLPFQRLSDGSIAAELLDGNLAVPSIGGPARGNIDDRVYLAPSGNVTFRDNRSVIGKPVVVAGDDAYLNGLTLSFDLAQYAAASGIEDLTDFAVYALSRDGSYEYMESSRSDGFVLSCEIGGSGVYFALNIRKFLGSFGVDPDAYVQAESPATDIMSLFSMFKYIKGQADVVFVINAPRAKKYAAEGIGANIAEFARRLDAGYNVLAEYAAITYTDVESDGADSIRIVKNGATNWFGSAAALSAGVDAIGAHGGGNAAGSAIDALEAARGLDWRPTAEKFVILVTDAPYKTGTRQGDISLAEAAGRLKADGITASVITYSGDFSSYHDITYDYSPLWKITGGVRANVYGDNKAELLNVAEHIGKKTSAGEWIILTRGYRREKLPALPADHSQDTDGDGLSDMFELNILVPAYFNTGTKRVLLPAYFAYSDPTLRDTDGDGVEDSEDRKPWDFPVACVRENAQYSLTAGQWTPVVPRYISIYGRSKEIYDLVLDQFDVENNVRYAKVEKAAAEADGTYGAGGAKNTGGSNAAAAGANGAGNASDANEVKNTSGANAAGGAGNANNANGAKNANSVKNTNGANNADGTNAADGANVANGANAANGSQSGQPAEYITWCNIFVWDVTVAMNAEIPHYYNPADGSKMTDLKPGNYTEMNADGIADWLATFGPAYGWREIAKADAQKRANGGYPVVSVTPGGGHAQMICPSRGNDEGPMTAQAGGRNVRYARYQAGMGNLKVKFYTHD